MKYMKIIKLIGLLAFIYILSLLDYALVIESLMGLNLGYVFIYTVLWYLFFIAKVYRWHLIQNYFSTPLSFKQNFWVFLETIYLSYVTPAKIGDIARLWIMKEHFNINKKDSLFGYIFDRFQDLYFTIIFALFGVFFIVKVDISIYWNITFILLVLSYLFKNKLFQFIGKKYQYISNMKTDFVFELKIFLLNVILFFLYFTQVYILARAMNLDIEFAFIIALVSISALATLLPISIGGLGVREGVFIVLLANVGIAKEDAVILSLLDNVVFVVIFIILLHIFSRVYLSRKNLGEKY